ncbi:MAG: 2OG-Fe(II) oxygenase [Alphaproteobacteria bacterium]
MTNFIEAYPNVLSADDCEAIIARFEADARREKSKTQRGVNEKTRTGTMLDIAEYDDWADIREKVDTLVRRRISLYIDKYRSLANMATDQRSYLSPPLLEKIEAGQGYNWHIDAGPVGTHKRILSSLIYLRDVDEGGATEFPYQQAAVKPKQGMLILFPPFWTHLHRGAEVQGEGVKYNITNFLVLKDNEAPA